MGRRLLSHELLPRLFDVYVQVTSSLERSQGGLGIGLALVKRLVELHGGSITAFSDGKNCGSTFEVVFPGEMSTATRPQRPADALPPDGVRILLIEDNDDGREMMAMMLIAHGHHVYQAGNSVEGLALALAVAPEIALIDIGLPGIDGNEVAREIRAHVLSLNMRLVALTGYGLDDDTRRITAAGFDLHLIKPVEPRQLLAALVRPARTTRPAS